MMRRPFQGVWNIIRFNWPFYSLSVGLVLFIFIFRSYSIGVISLAADIVLTLTIGLTLISLLVSWYVYDLSDFYAFNWLSGSPSKKAEKIVNINAGFDETSQLLADRFAGAELIACDFYDPKKHTEPSIKRARKAYPPFPGTRSITTGQVPLEDGSIDRIFVILSAHEIRDADERKAFFSELNRSLAASGRIVVVEHLRDTANYMAYNVGALHFHSRSAWLSTFRSARLTVEAETKITPFITAFLLNKNGTES